MNGDSLAPRVRRWYERYLPFAVRPSKSDQSSPTVEERSSAAATKAVVSRAWENQDVLASLTDDELQALENRDVPSIDRASDSAEARADEKQEVTSSLNFPLHWTTPEQSVSLSHVRRLAMAAGFSKMRVVPLRSLAAYVFEYAATPADAVPLSAMWEETLRLGPGEHARFVPHKGDDPSADTFLPAHQLIGRLAARIVPLQVSAATSAREAFTDRLRITNVGTVTWKAHGRRFGGQVTCGLKICDAQGEVLREDLGRTPLPRDVDPGDEIEIAVTVAGVLPAGSYVLRYDMVVEGVTWFEFQGAPCVQRVLEVVSPAD